MKYFIQKDKPPAFPLGFVDTNTKSSRFKKSLFSGAGKLFTMGRPITL